MTLAVIGAIGRILQESVQTRVAGVFSISMLKLIGMMQMGSIERSGLAHEANRSLVLASPSSGHYRLLSGKRRLGVIGAKSVTLES